MLVGEIQIQSVSQVVLAISALLAIASLLAVITSRLRIPLALILVSVGFVAGELARSNGVDLPVEGKQFNNVLLFIFLPVLVFEAALAMPVRVFARELKPIGLLAVAGVAVSAGIVAAFVHFGLDVALTSALLFGVLISATDPTAVIDTFKQVRVPPRLLVLVEGESLLNDGVATVLFNIVLVAALGTQEIGVLEGVGKFVLVFAGATAVGVVLGLGTAEIAARLGRFPSTALTIAIAYGSFALAQGIFSFSGVMASLSAGIVLAAFSRTLIPSDVFATWEQVWGALAFVANGLLFVLIGVVIDADLIADNLTEMGIGVAAVIISRPIAVLAVTRPVNRLARIPAVGFRNELVLIWGGLRGGVALALALAIPQRLPEQEAFIAMAAGAVIATLILNATTMAWLIRLLRLDEPDEVERFVASAARFDGARIARSELHRTLEDVEIESRLTEVERAAAEEIAGLALNPDALHQALLRRGLAVERASLQELIDEGLLPQWHGRVALGNLEDQLDELSMGRISTRGLFETTRPERLVYEVARRIHMGRLTPEKWVELAYRDLQARIRATSDAIDAISTLSICPGVAANAIDRATGEFETWRSVAQANLDRLLAEAPGEALSAAHRHYAADLARLTSRHELIRLAEVGLVSSVAVDRATELIVEHLEACERERMPIAIEEDEDVGT